MRRENGFADSILVVVASQQEYYKACVTDTTVQQKMCGTWLNIATTVFSIRPDCGKIFIEGANYFRAVLDDASWKTHGFCPDNCIFSIKINQSYCCVQFIDRLFQLSLHCF